MTERRLTLWAGKVVDALDAKFLLADSNVEKPIPNRAEYVEAVLPTLKRFIQSGMLP